MRKTDGLAFTNISRSYDASADGVNFWAYDNVVEVSFLVSTEVLSNLRGSDLSDEAQILAAFDGEREHIQELARGVYAKRSRDKHLFAYTITAAGS